MKVFYLHGFNSGAKPNHPRVRLLEDEEYEVEVVNYDTSMPHNELGAWFDEYLADQTVDERSDTGIIGTSLGGYWAAYLGHKYQQLWIAINPAIEPRESLKRHLDKQLVNFVHGNEWRLDPDVPPSYKYPFATDYNGLVILNMGDESLDSGKTAEFIEKSGASLLKREGGAHRFEDWSSILDDINQHFRGAWM